MFCNHAPCIANLVPLNNSDDLLRIWTVQDYKMKYTMVTFSSTVHSEPGPTLVRSRTHEKKYGNTEKQLALKSFATMPHVVRFQAAVSTCLPGILHQEYRRHFPVPAHTVHSSTSPATCRRQYLMRSFMTSCKAYSAWRVQ